MLLRHSLHTRQGKTINVALHDFGIVIMVCVISFFAETLIILVLLRSFSRMLHVMGKIICYKACQRMV